MKKQLYLMVPKDAPSRLVLLQGMLCLVTDPVLNPRRDAEAVPLIQAFDEAWQELHAQLQQLEDLRASFGLEPAGPPEPPKPLQEEAWVVFSKEALEAGEGLKLSKAIGEPSFSLNREAARITAGAINGQAVRVLITLAPESGDE